MQSGLAHQVRPSSRSHSSAAARSASARPSRAARRRTTYIENWDDRITTLPGLYAIPSALHAVGLLPSCRVSLLRLVRACVLARYAPSGADWAVGAATRR